MLSKCANPSCTNLFHYLKEGRLFQMDTDADGPHMVRAKRPARKVEYFWLCDHCVSEMTLSYQRGKGVITVPLQQAQRAAAS